MKILQGFVALLAVLAMCPADAAELKIFGSRVTQVVVAELAPQFEKATGFKPVVVADVVRGAEDFTNGTAELFFFAFGAPKVREVDDTVGGIRALEIPQSGMAAAKKLVPQGYLSPAVPNPFFVGVDHPMGVYTWDNMLFTNSKVKDEVIYKIIETLENNKADLVAVQPALREVTAAKLYKDYDIPYHPGALKYFKDHKIEEIAVQ